MDVGVGSFIISDALLSKPNQQQLSRESVKAAGQLAMVGLLRIVATKAIAYQEHVGEYGVHWNFFLTLAAVKLAGLGIPTKASGVVGLALGVFYQILLSGFGLADYVNSELRDEASLLSMNKEGVISLIGYVFLHCLARFFAHSSQMYTLADRTSPQSTKRSLVHTHFFYTVGFTGACWFVALILDATVESVSRRSVNAAYVFWVMANNLTWILCLYGGRLLLDLQEDCFLCMVINKTAFGAFLAANVLVGLVNSMMDTLAVTDGIAIVILAAYMFLVCCLSRALYTRGGGSTSIMYKGKKLKADHSPETEL